MKKYLKMLPVMIYPYAYLPWLIGSVSATMYFEELVGSESVLDVAMWILIIYQIVTLASVIFGVASAVRKYSAKDAAKVNMVVKLVQIPAYIFHFILGAAGFFMSVWGIGFLLFAIAIDLVTIALTGIHAIGNMVKLRKEKILSTPLAILAGIGSFIYCVDLVVAIVLVVVCSKKSKNVKDTKPVEIEGPHKELQVGKYGSGST